MKIKALIVTMAVAVVFSATAHSQAIFPRRDGITATSVLWTTIGVGAAVILSVQVNPVAGIVSGGVVAAPFIVTIVYATPSAQKSSAASSAGARYRVQLVKEDAAAFLANQDTETSEAPSLMLSELFEQIRATGNIAVSDDDIARALVMAEEQEALK